MKAYSEDLRQKVVQAVERRMPKTQAARLFGISLSSDQTHPTEGRIPNAGALVEAMGAAISVVAAKDARGFFEHRG